MAAPMPCRWASSWDFTIIWMNRSESLASEALGFHVIRTHQGAIPLGEHRQGANRALRQRAEALPPCTIRGKMLQRFDAVLASPFIRHSYSRRSLPRPAPDDQHALAEIVAGKRVGPARQPHHGAVPEPDLRRGRGRLLQGEPVAQRGGQPDAVEIA